MKNKNTPKKNVTNPKKWILPAIAAAAVVVAVGVTVLQPGKDKNGGNSEATASSAVTASTTSDGKAVISASSLSAENVSFIRPIEGSKIEVLARLGDDGEAKIALGTCQSCNGAPGAFYTQNGDVLQCNNCGLTFPVSVLDQPGGGCHPIMMDESVYSVTGDGITIDTEKLKEYETLFTNVADH